MKIGISSKGSFKNTESFLEKSKKLRLSKKLNQYGMLGAAALAANTPIDTGKTAESWGYEITEKDGHIQLVWTNSNLTAPHKSNRKGIPIAILIQYGHGTRNGGYVQGRDYINPAIRPIFDEIAHDIWKEVCSL